MSKDTGDTIARTSRLVTDKIDAAPEAIRAMLHRLNHAACDRCDYAAGYKEFAGLCTALANEMWHGEIKTCLEGLRAVLVSHSVALVNHQEAIRTSSLAADAGS